MARQRAGIDPLGHLSHARVKEEGPKMHHDNHGKTDSQPLKGKGYAIPGEHWERAYNPDPEYGMNDPKGAFCPKVASERPNTHNMVNKTDH